MTLHFTNCSSFSLKVAKFFSSLKKCLLKGHMTNSNKINSINYTNRLFLFQSICLSAIFLQPGNHLTIKYYHFSLTLAKSKQLINKNSPNLPCFSRLFSFLICVCTMHVWWWARRNLSVCYSRDCRTWKYCLCRT